jgi:predicted RNA-binding Zn-ribbon protein involved in translation (DUF1610 family)
MSAVGARDLAALQRALQRPGALATQTVYECPDCGDRFVGQRRCEDCGVFCRALGLGGACPDCDAVLVLRDLLAEEVPPS